MNVTGREAGVLDDVAEKKREAAEEMGSLMTSQGRSDASQSGRETNDARQASVMKSEGKDTRRVTVVTSLERKR